MSNVLPLNQIMNEDCVDGLKQLPDESVDLIVTSPPYADQRKKDYGGTPPDEYVDWFLPISEELLRVLKPTGSFVLNIKEKIVDGERHPYVMELIIAMRAQGWRWNEEYIWHKTTCMPGKWPTRFRDAWERCIHFTKQKEIKMFQEAVMVPIGDWTKVRMGNLSDKDKKRTPSATNSGFGTNLQNWVDKEMVLPTNVLHFPPVTGNAKHSAAFPKELPKFFIKAFTDVDDVVLDPFMGSGTTAKVCLDLDRKYVGFEKLEKYFTETVNTLADYEPIADVDPIKEAEAAIEEEIESVKEEDKQKALMDEIGLSWSAKKKKE